MYVLSRAGPPLRPKDASEGKKTPQSLSFTYSPAGLSSWLWTGGGGGGRGWKKKKKGPLNNLFAALRLLLSPSAFTGAALYFELFCLYSFQLSICGLLPAHEWRWYRKLVVT